MSEQAPKTLQLLGLAASLALSNGREPKEEILPEDIVILDVSDGFDLNNEIMRIIWQMIDYYEASLRQMELAVIGFQKN